ncbi:MAG: cytochrome c biogenesis protein CcsA [Kofleriaceae bacterium]|nr:cytochrome c biogenesis protein CcsA [Kofleriaceae bacterium]
MLAVVAAAALAVTLHLIFFVTPLERQLFFNQKIFYWHVPNWFVLFTSVFVCGLASAVYLKNRNPRWDDALAPPVSWRCCSAPSAWSPGSIWGKAAWGHWCSWELRLTTSLILWLTMVGYVLVRRFGGAGSERLAAGLAVFGVVNVPLVYFAVKLTDALQQESAHPRAGSSASSPRR